MEFKGRGVLGVSEEGVSGAPAEKAQGVEKGHRTAKKHSSPMPRSQAASLGSALLLIIPVTGSWNKNRDSHLDGHHNPQFYKC